ncbi:hypothetical protein C8Q74DRAFT_1362384 [Fomes fomentarius]|nr:hypothetical protein C8Q74DRAFT_1362384 [Fomes fomentarius]
MSKLRQFTHETAAESTEMMAAYAPYLNGDVVSFDEGCLSSKDKSRLALLSPPQVPEWADPKIEKYSKRILALKSARNASVPINRRLPPEVLMEVFSYMEPGSDGRQRFHILHVCRLWRHLVFRTSRFWADVLRTSRALGNPTKDQVAQLELFFKLSRLQPLSLSIERLDANVSGLLFPHAHHISSLTVTLHAYQDELLNALLHESMPLLENLRVRHPPDRPSYPKVKTLCPRSAHLPRLRSLRHPYSCVDLSGIRDQLQTLELVQCPCRQCYDAQSKDVDFLGLLEPCAALTALSLKSEGTESQTISVLHPHDSIDLPALQKIEIEILDAQAVSAFLSCLSLPASCFVQLSCYSRTFREQLPAAIDSFPPISAATSAKIHLRGQGRITFETHADGSKLLQLTVSDSNAFKASWAPYVRDLATVFASSRGLTSITIRTTMDFALDVEDIKDALHSLLESVPQLLRLDVTGFNGQEDIVALLRETSPGGGLLCPLLAELRVQWCYRGHTQAGFEADTRRIFTRYPTPPLHTLRTKQGALRRFCDALVHVLLRRAYLGSRLTTLTIDIVPTQRSRAIITPGYYDAITRPYCEMVLAEEGGLHARLGDSVENVAVRFTDEDFDFEGMQFPLLYF